MHEIEQLFMVHQPLVQHVAGINRRIMSDKTLLIIHQRAPAPLISTSAVNVPSHWSHNTMQSYTVDSLLCTTLSQTCHQPIF